VDPPRDVQWQLSPVLVRAELTKLCSPLGDVISIHIAPYVDGPRENKLRNALKVCSGVL